VQKGIGFTVDGVVPVDVGVLPKTSSGKLQAPAPARVRAGELGSQVVLARPTPVDAVKEGVKSQIGYFRHASIRRSQGPQRVGTKLAPSR